MGKATGRKSESWKPAVVHDSSFISKNKKRKDQRYTKSLSPSKMIGGLDELKSAAKNLMLSGKFSRNVNTPSPNKKKRNVDTPNSGPRKVDKKDTSLLNPIVSSTKKNQGKFTGILSNSNTPKKKVNTKVTFDEKPSSKKFIDDEASEGEEPITDKPVKPLHSTKNNKSPKALKARRPSMAQVEESEDEDEEDSDADQPVDSLIDKEASEGEETDSEDEGSDDDGDLLFSFSDDDDDDGEEDDDDDDDDDEEDEDDEEETIVQPKSQAKTVSKSLKKKQTKQEPSSDEDDDDDDEDDEKIDEKVKSKTTKTTQKKPISKQASDSEEDSEDESTKISKQAQPQKKNLVNGTSNIKGKSEVKKGKMNVDNKNVVSTEKTSKSDKPTNFVGFVRGIPEKVSKDQIKAALGTKIDSKSIVKIIGTQSSKKKEKCFLIYLQTDDALQSLLNEKFKVADTVITVYKARENTQRPRGEKQPIAFLPRVPTLITNDSLKQGLEKEFGANSIHNIRHKNTIQKFQTRNVLVQFSNEEIFIKAIKKGELNVDGKSIVIREAHEAGLKVPLYRAVISKVPDKTTIATLKKAVEGVCGKDTVTNVRSSIHKHSFAFVLLENAEAQKKLLTAKTLTVNGAKLEVVEYVPRPKKKRDFAKRKAPSVTEETQPNKKQKMNDPKLSKNNVEEEKPSNKKPVNGQPSMPSDSSQQKSNKKSQKRKERVAEHFKKEAKPKAAKKEGLQEKIATKKQNLKQKKGKRGND